MDKIDGFLSNKAQRLWPGAEVRRRELGGEDARGRPRELWILERPGFEPIEIGGWFKAAQMTISAMVRAEEERRKRDGEGG